MIFLIEYLHIYIYTYIVERSPVYLRDIFSVFTVTYIPRKHWRGYRGAAPTSNAAQCGVRWAMPLPGYRCRIRIFFFFFSFLDMRWSTPTRANLCQFRSNRIVSASWKWSIQADTGFELGRNSSKNYYFFKKSAKTSLNKKLNKIKKPSLPPCLSALYLSLLSASLPVF